MKVIIEDGCIACGACESFCPDVFKMEDVCVVDEANIAGNEDSIKDAADACPVSVISVVE
ncbi:MAG: ferredoxin [Candidatus Gastranaerophilales bacterium]|jgi:ferredoxin|nr:ferredoxin [Candidatus Gastranaerophilales bacterium]